MPQVWQLVTVDPVQFPVPDAVHPGHCAWLQLLNCPHVAHDSVGMPTHDGPTENTCGPTGACRLTVVQQICPEQSLSVLHDLGHVREQMPSQQRLLPVQSLEVLHAVGQVGFVGSGARHRPGALRLGSILLSVVQHTWPFVVSHSLLVEHDLGQSLAGVQKLVL
jgi:hypothetical protein